MGQTFGTQRLNNVTNNEHYQNAVAQEFMILEQYADLRCGEGVAIRNISFEFQGKETFMHTLISGEENEQCIVLLHGYLASSLFYYKMIKKLSQQYRVYSVDLLGMGLSDRRKFDIQQPQSAETAIKFFVDSFEEWRKAIGIEKFTLAGHSFGGFISFNYYLAHPENIEQLYLLSPMSASSVDPKRDLRDEDVFQKYVSSLKFKSSLFLKFLRYANKNKKTLSKFLQSSCIPSNYFLNKIIDARFRFDSKQEKEDWKKYFKCLQFLPESTDHLIHEFVSMPYVQSKLSMEQLIEKNKLNDQKIPIHFIYGDDDWMDYSGTYRLINSQQVYGTIKFIKDAGHLIPFEKPEALVDLMLKHMKLHKGYLNNIIQLKNQKAQYAI